MIQQVCGNCDGVGQIIRNPCMTCRGRGTTHATAKETINIPKGVDNGVNLRVAKKGHAGQGGPHGDLIIHVKVRSHAYFKREGANIHTELYLNIGQAVLGGDLIVKTLYGNVTIKIPPGTQHEERKKISNYGIQKLPPNHHQKGNHYVSIKVVIPKKLTDDQRKAMLAYA